MKQKTATKGKTKIKKLIKKANREYNIPDDHKKGKKFNFFSEKREN